jgi:intracellular septation protein
MTGAKPKPHPGWTLAIDYGPLLVFFVAFRFTDAFGATAAFMVAISIALVVSAWKLGRVSPMLWLSAILVIGFGALTIWLHDQRFIQIKPTAIYLLLGGLLVGGVVIGKPLLKYVLEAGYDGLSDRGWMVQSRNWGLFFLTMAALNEVLRATVSFETWLTIKVWALPILSFVFAAANIPFMMKHGLGEPPAADPPPSA